VEPISPKAILHVADILRWVDAHHHRTGKWPKQKSGPGRRLMTDADARFTPLALVPAVSLTRIGSGRGNQISYQLIDWHLADPPDDFERRRNALIAELQGNRNPFVDHPQWVQDIFIVPEPSVLWLMLVGVGFCAWRRR